MSRNLPRPLVLTTLLVSVLTLTAATQGAKFPAGSYKANNGTNNIAIDFDTTGAINVFVDGQAFSSSAWQAKADTLSFGPVTNAPEGYNCAASGTYLWSIADTRITFTLVADDCQSRLQALTGLAWTNLRRVGHA